jgi:hypothetical protein
MSKWHNFLVEYAKFPFPLPDESRTVGTTDLSDIEVGLLETEWKAKYAVRDDALIQKLCNTLKNILGDTPLTDDPKDFLLNSFGPNLLVDQRGRADRNWHTNLSEAHVSFSTESMPIVKVERFKLTLGIESEVIRQGILPRR